MRECHEQSDVERDLVGAFEFKPGDAVVHRLRPDWGVGEILSAESVTHNGAPCQRVQARFPRGGQRTLLTAVAPLHVPERAQEAPAAAAVASETAEPLSVETLRELPDAVTDPFRTEAARLESALRLYRFSGQGGALLAWAQLQTGLKDPLSEFTRHELEDAWLRFRRNLDNATARLLASVRRKDAGAASRLLADAPEEARHAMRRLDSRR